MGDTASGSRGGRVKDNLGGGVAAARMGSLSAALGKLLLRPHPQRRVKRPAEKYGVEPHETAISWYKMVTVDNFIQSNLKLPDGKVQEGGHGWWWLFSCSVVSDSL